MMNDVKPQNNTTTNQSVVTSKAASKAALPEYGEGEAIDGLSSNILASNPGSIIHKPQEHRRDIATSMGRKRRNKMERTKVGKKESVKPDILCMVKY